MSVLISDNIKINPTTAIDVNRIIASRSIYESTHKQTISEYALPLYEGQVDNWLAINQEISLFLVSFFDSSDNIIGIGGAYELNRPSGVVELFIDAPLDKPEITFFILDELTKIMKENYWFKTMIVWVPLYKQFTQSIENLLDWNLCVKYPEKIRWNNTWIDHGCLSFSATNT